MADDFERAAEFLRSAKRVAVLTGAGVSAESGVPTFRASDGLWEGHAIEDVATPAGYRRDPLLVWRFYNARRANVGKVQPNPGHGALADMEKRWGDGFTLITQNVDGLHYAAGNRNVLELHGSLYRTRCAGCGEIKDRGLEPLGDSPKCPGCGGTLRPDIVWFTEPLPGDILRKAERAAETCDVLLVVGTSAVVYPAAGVIPIARHRRNPAAVIECNLTRTDASDLADVGLYGPSGETLPKLMAIV
ncbi:MAG TPA: NAD-dependent deacylase [Fimbriiglobus sp.]|jgi:NAD-dependent deacetylase